MRILIHQEFQEFSAPLRVTIYLDREGYRIPGKRSPSQSHGVVQEHLENYLAEGWSIKLIAGAGGGGGGAGSTMTHEAGCGWVVVVLEKL